MNFCSDARREVPVLVVDRLDARAVDRQQLAAEQIETPAQDHELPENLLERGAIGAPEIGDGLEVRLQRPQQPDDLDVAMAFGLEPPARPHPVEIAIYVELQQIAGRVAGPARRLRLDPLETRGLQIEPIDEGVDEPHGIVGADIIVNRFRQKQELRAFESGYVRHAGFLPQRSATESRQSDFSHGLLEFWTSVTGAAIRKLRRQLQRFGHGGGVMPDHPKIGARRRIGDFAPLFPVAQSSKRDVKPLRKFFLRQPKRTANDAHRRRLLHAPEVFRRKRLRVGVAKRGGVALFVRRRVKAAPVAPRLSS